MKNSKAKVPVDAVEQIESTIDRVLRLTVELDAFELGLTREEARARLDRTMQGEKPDMEEISGKLDVSTLPFLVPDYLKVPRWRMHGRRRPLDESSSS